MDADKASNTNKADSIPVAVSLAYAVLQCITVTDLSRVANDFSYNDSFSNTVSRAVIDTIAFCNA
jgi:hypothetical protein